MRRAAKVDGNQEAIVKALRAHGWSVLSLAPMGKGCPDLLVGVRGLNVLLEVKDGSKPPSARRLTLDEQRFFGAWNGHRGLVESPEQAVAAVRRHLREMRGPDWTAEEWKYVAATLLWAKDRAPEALRPADGWFRRVASDCEAMARELEGGHVG